MLRRICAEQEDCHVAQYSIGFTGYYAGPDVFIVDRYGLASALIARINPIITPDWRIGHFIREIPDGYFDYLSSGDDSAIKDLELCGYITALELVTQGEIVDTNRLRTMMDLWTGKLQFPE